MKKSNKQIAWEKKLREIYKEDLESGLFLWEDIIDWYPTEKDMIEQDLWLKEHKKNSDLYDQLRLKFNNDDEFEVFKTKALKDNSLLERYVKKEEITSFQDFLKMRGLNTSGNTKLLNYFKDLLRDNTFINKVKKIREKYEIPKNGLNYNNENKDKFSKNESFFREILHLKNRYSLFNNIWYTIFEYYIIFNKSDLRELSYIYLDFDLCKIDTVGVLTEENTSEDFEFPVMIKVSPYASGRDIIDFIKKNSKSIENMQKHYRLKNIKIGKSKKKKSIIQERNDFIYKHRHLKLNEIMEKIGDKFGSTQIIDTGYIGKIISTEKKRRKDV